MSGRGGSGRRGLGENRLLTVSEVCQEMRVSSMTVYRLIKNGDLPAIRLGRSYRIRESDVDDYLSGRSVEAGDS